MMNIARKLTAFLGSACLFFGLTGNAVPGNLTVYSSALEAVNNEIIAAFHARYPDIHVQIIRDSAGVIVARLLAERNNPRADIVHAMVASAMVVLDQQNMLEAYQPAGYEHLKPNIMKDTLNPVPHWVPYDFASMAICFNTAEAGDITPPQSWRELADPKYRSKIVMPNPNSSGSGLTMIAHWLEFMGAEEGWNFMRALNENITQYVHSGSAPCRMAARGETLIGLSYPSAGVPEITRGAPLRIIFPIEGNAAEIGGSAILKGTKNLEDARKFADFLISEETQTIIAKYFAIVVREGIDSNIVNYPQGEEQGLYFIDYLWLADNKQRLLDEWRELFDAKSAPRN